MRRLIAIGLTVPALLALPALASDDRYNPNKMICKVTIPTGTRVMTERICLTRRQWNELSYRTQDKHEENIKNSALNPAGSK